MFRQIPRVVQRSVAELLWILMIQGLESHRQLAVFGIPGGVTGGGPGHSSLRQSFSGVLPFRREHRELRRYA